MSKIVEALSAGWTVSSVANVLAHGKNDEGRGFLIRLTEPDQHMSQEVYLPYSEEAQKLLKI